MEPGQFSSWSAVTGNSATNKMEFPLTVTKRVDSILDIPGFLNPPRVLFNSEIYLMLN